ncbi:MAG: aminodeoxychorismate synthase component I [Bacteroidaceae bacterium]|nr:aminodeoxychorismate synthase component I [Bacteroidaceae bacterium]
MRIFLPNPLQGVDLFVPLCLNINGKNGMEQYDVRREAPQGTGREGWCSHEEARRRMNALGAAAVPYLFAVSYDGDMAFVSPLADIDAAACLYDFRGLTNVAPTADAPARPQRWDVEPPEREAYRRSFETVRQAILRGDSYLVNLSCRIPLTTDARLRDLFALARAPYRLWMRGRMVCFSPETFVEIRDGEIRTCPMKGTLPADVPDAEARLMGDRKEAAEHATVVDLLRNDLSMVAEHVGVSRYRYVDRIATHRGLLLQTSSEIRGTLPTDWPRRLGDILFTMLPAGSVTGAPKPRTQDIIHQAEGHRRGFYTGVMGCFDGRRLDSAVMIRFVEQTADGRRYYHAGGGITALSQWQSEYDEVMQKTYLPISSGGSLLFLETIRAEAGRYHNLDLHDLRLNDTARRHFTDWEPLRLRALLPPPPSGEGRTRVRVIYGQGGIREVTTSPYQPRILRRLHLRPADHIDYAHKYLDRRALDHLRQSLPPDEDILLVRDGLLTDASFANVALWDGHEWHTPARPLLEGTMRRRLIADGRLRPLDITPAMLPRYRRIALINAMLDLGDLTLAVCDIDLAAYFRPGI